MKYYEHHLGDFLRDTQHLTMMEYGAYHRLICVYYNREAPIPKAPDVIFRLVSAESKTEKAATLAVLKQFFQLTKGGWRQARCDEEIVRYNERREKARNSGLASGQARRNERSANVERTLNESSTLHTPYSNLQSEEKNSEGQKARFRKPELDAAVRKVAVGMKTKESP